MTLAEAIETTRIHRVAGLTGDRTALVTTRPCRAPTTPSRMRGWSAGFLVKHVTQLLRQLCLYIVRLGTCVTQRGVCWCCCRTRALGHTTAS